MKNEKSSVFMKLIVLTAFLLIGWMKPYQAYAADMVTVEITGQYDQREDSAAGARAMLTMINDFRTGRYVDGGKSTVWALAENGTVDTATYTNLGELSYDYELEKVAIQRAMELAVRFSHDRPNGEKIELLYPDKYSSMGENIAVGTGNTCNTAKKAFDAWCETTELYSGQGHRRNMLYKYFNRVGIAHVIFHYGNTEIDYWVQEFGYCTGSFGLSSTDPLNDSETISVEIDADLIQTIDIKCDKDSLEIDYGQTHDFSEASSVLRLSETWPERIGGSTYLVTVDGGYSLSSDDTSIAGITGQTITGKKAGTTKISVQSLLDSSIRKVLDLTVNPASIKDAEVKLPYSETIYSGNEQKPAPDVTLGEKTLTSGEDYEVSYENNVNAGTAKVIVTGKGNYKDNASAEFEITQKPLTNSMVIKDKGADNSYTYDGTLQQPDINVKDGDVDLVKEKDYSLSMDDSINSGDYTVTVTGTGNYTEQATASYKINPAPISSATAVLDKDALVYSGIKQAPVLTLTFNDIVLKEGDDYTLSVPDAIDCGEYTITIEGKGNFTGKTTKTFKIRQKPLSEDMIQLEKTSYTYDGTLFKPSVAVKSADSQKELEENKDYIIEKNEGGTSVGQYPVKISAKEGGNYSGQVEVSFSIVPKSLEKDMFKLENRTYNGKAGVPDITATFNGTEVTYKIVEGIGTNAGSHELTLEGTENYTGQVKADYKINPAPISSDNIKLDKKELVYNGKNQVPNPTVTFNDTVLKQGNDYEVTPDQDAVNCGKYTIGIEGTGNYTGQVTADYQINPAQISAAKADLDKEELEYTGSKQAPVLTLTFNGIGLKEGDDYTLSVPDAIDCGEYTITIDGKGNFTEQTSKTFEITQKALEDGWIQLDKDSIIYDGDFHKPSVTVTGVDGQKLEENKDYIIDENEGGTSAGQYPVKISAKEGGNYSDQAEVSFSIEPKSLEEDMFTLEDRTYNGKDEAPIINATYNGKDVTYKIDGIGTDAGSHELTLEGTGNYTDQVTVLYQINPAPISSDNIKLDKKELEYNGKNQVPNPTVTFNDTVLKEGDDYEVTSDQNAVGCGDYKVSIEGTGNYTGQVTADYQINPAQISAAKADLDKEELEYTGSKQAPVLTLTFNDIGLKEGDDYTLSVPDAIDCGDYTITIEGKGNFTGDTTKGFTIIQKPASSTKPETTPANNQNSTAGSGKTSPGTTSSANENQMGSDGTALGKGASAAAAEKAITSLKNDNDPAGAKFAPLMLKSSSQTKTSEKLAWKKVPGAKEYVVYGNKCGKANKMKRIAATGNNKYTVKKAAGQKLKKGTYYKYLVVALDGNKNVITTSKVIHVATKGGKFGNHKTITTAARKNKAVIKKGKTFKLKAKAVLASKNAKAKKHVAVRYETSNNKIASVTAKGVIKGLNKGSCKIYVYAQNGVVRQIKVTVK